VTDRIKRPDITGANVFRYDEKCSPESKEIINALLSYIFELELTLAGLGRLQSTVEGFDHFYSREEKHG
jgi:hypothetical protein